MFGKLFTFGAAVSAALCVGACVLSVRGGRTRTAREFRRADGVWEVASERGRFRLDNAPQLRLEREWTLGERRRLCRECAALARERDALQTRLKRQSNAEHDDRPAIEAELTRLTDLGAQNAMERRAVFGRPDSTTVPVSHSAPAFVVAMVTGLPPVAWGALAVAIRRRGRRQAEQGLCLACGYDLRATPGRCPECGTPASRGSAPELLSALQ